MSELHRHRIALVFGWLIRALPRSDREGFEDDMVHAFRESVASTRPRSFQRLATIMASFLDALRLAASAWSLRLRARIQERLSKRSWAATRRRRAKEAFMPSLHQDVRQVMRLTRSRPGFVVIVTATLALGIGASTAVFSVVNAVLLDPLPYEAPDELALLWGHMSSTEVTRAPWSGPDLMDFRARSRTFPAIAAASGFNVTLTGDFEPEPAQLGWATANFFGLLGVEPILGRDFLPSDEKNLPPELFVPGSSPPPGVTILGYDLWQRRFGGRHDVLGTMVRVAGQPMEIVGVAPRGFRLYLPADAAMSKNIDLWAAIPFDLSMGPRDGQWLTVIGRLASGVSLDEAQGEMSAIAAQLRSENQFHENVGMEIDVVPMRQDVVGHTEHVLYALFGAVGFVLLIACANVANLQLLRAQGRRRELAVRAAIGGSRARIARQMVMESVVLALGGAVLGLVVARLGIELLLFLEPANLPRLEHVAMDPLVFVFAFVAAALSAVLFGVLPALSASRFELAESLQKRGSVGAGGSRESRRYGLRHALVVTEVALALLLLVGAGLMVRSFEALVRVHPGFEARQVLTTNVALPYANYGGGEERFLLHERLLESIRVLPGVEAVGAVTPLPLGGGGQYWFGPYALHEANDEEWSRNEVDYRVTLPGFLDALGTTLLAGRALDLSDHRPDAPRRVMVDDELAAEAWPGRTPVGERILVMRPSSTGEFERYWAEVVGVVEHIRFDDLRDDGRGTIYFPFVDWFFSDMNYVVRTDPSVDAASLASAVRATVREVGDDIPAAPVLPLASYVDEALAPTTFALVVLGVFAAVASLLAAIGLYGVLAYTVRERRKELALRIAVGASTRDILGLVMSRGLSLTLVGVGIGAAAAAFVSRGISALLFEVSPTDPLTYAVIATMLTVVAAFSSYLPAWRASSVDPLEALREE